MNPEEFTTLKPEEYRALEDIVGPDFVTMEPNLLDGYCFSWGTEDFFEPGLKFLHRPLGVVMPANTIEVQGIVRLCNRYRIPFKAISTGFGPMGLISDAPFLSLDLRRMDRIIDIDEKNMFAVFEPYVTFGGLTNASIKKGVRPYVIGAGPSCSPVANATNAMGYGTTNVSAGWGGRVPLALEWVMPDGELMRMGTLGTSRQWFCGDGPGPSLRGIFRGISGPAGCMGVFTKLAMKLVPWYGPPRVEFYGDPPKYKAKLPESIEVITIVFPSRDAMIDAMYLVHEEKIAYWCSRRGPFTMAAATTSSNREVLELWDSGEFQRMLEKFNHNLSIGLDSSSTREGEFKKKCLMRIAERFGGEEFKETPDGLTARFVHAFNGLGAVKGTFRATGRMGSAPAAEETIDAVRLATDLGVAIKNKYAKKKSCMDDGDSTWITLLEDFGAHMETPFRYDGSSSESVRLSAEQNEEANKMLLDRRLGIGEFESGLLAGNQIHEEAGPVTMNYHTWVKRVKKVIDPNLVGECTRYPTPIIQVEK